MSALARDFLFRGNVVDLAVAVVIGGAFGVIVTALGKDLLTPLIAAIVGEPDFSGLAFTINNSKFLVIPMNALTTRMKKPDAPAAATTRPCPECLSDIPLAANRCAHCTAVIAGRGVAAG